VCHRRFCVAYFYLPHLVFVFVTHVLVTPVLFGGWWWWGMLFSFAPRVFLTVHVRAILKQSLNDSTFDLTNTNYKVN
jgi:hypothetical protein